MPDVPRLYVDSCPIIDLVKIRRNIALRVPDGQLGKRKKDAAIFKLLCDASHDGAVQLYTSTLTVAECQHAGDIGGDRGPHQETRDLLHDFLLSGTYIRLVEADVFVAEQARNLRWEHGIALSGADALHVASALSMDCREFYTTDNKIKGGGKFATNAGAIETLGMRVVPPSETGFLPDAYRRDDLFDE